jgi:integrase/recombinase XerC
MASTEIVPIPPDGLPRVASEAIPIDLVNLAVAGLKATTVQGYRKDLGSFAAWIGQDVQLSLWALISSGQGQANSAALAYVDSMLARDLAPATVRRRVAALQRVLKVARRLNLTRIVLEVELPKAETFRDTAGPGRRAFDRMLAVTEERAGRGKRGAIRDSAILLLLHDRALRRSEVAGLDWPGDVDPGRPAVNVLGKGKRSKEWLTINPRTLEAITRWVEARGDWDGPLFIRVDNAAAGSRDRLDDESINRLVGRIADAAKVGRAVHAHGLRHSAITEALDSGWDVRDVRLFSRHAKIDTVLIYDDRRQDLGGEITRSIGCQKRRRNGV